MVKKIFGVILILLGIYFIVRPISINEGGTRAIGTILAVNQETSYSITDNRNETKTQVTIQYQTADEKTVEFETTDLPFFSNYHTDQQVAILYDTQDPALDVIIDSNVKWYLPGLLILFGILALFSGQISQMTGVFNNTKISGN